MPPSLRRVRIWALLLCVSGAAGVVTLTPPTTNLMGLCTDWMPVSSAPWGAPVGSVGDQNVYEQQLDVSVGAASLVLVRATGCADGDALLPAPASAAGYETPSDTNSERILLLRRTEADAGHVRIFLLTAGEAMPTLEVYAG